MTAHLTIPTSKSGGHRPRLQEMERAFDVFTMGFSNRTWEDTIKMLAGESVERLVDIRTLPGSRRTPQFNLENLAQKLPEAGIEYLHLKSLGGMRKPIRDSTLNAAWRNDGFRAYADYMQSPEFEKALETLLRLMTEKRTVYSCTEAARPGDKLTSSAEPRRH